MQLVKLRAQVMSEIRSAKREFCANAVTVERFVPNPQYPVDTTLSVSVHKICHAIASHEDSVMLTLHTPLSLKTLLHFEPYSFCTQQCLVDLYSDQLASCKVTSSFIESFSSNITSVDDFCTLLNVPLRKVAVDSSSSHYHKAVRKLSEGTYQWLRQQMEETYWYISQHSLLFLYIHDLLLFLQEIAGVSPEHVHSSSTAAPTTTAGYYCLLVVCGVCLRMCMCACAYPQTLF